MTSMPAMQEEIVDAFETVLNVSQTGMFIQHVSHCTRHWVKVTFDIGWKSISVHDNALLIFARLINRFFVGIPLCRDGDFIENCVGYVSDVAIGGYLIRVWPEWMKP